MYYYKFHIGDYRAATSHLSNDEDLAYRRLLDMYYDTEKPIPNDTEWVSRRLRLDTDLVLSVLKDFFILQDDGWFHGRCHEVIHDYHCQAEKNRTNGKGGGRPKKTQPVSSGMPIDTDSQPDGKATINHKPETINQEPLTIVKAARASRLPQDWQPNDRMLAFCENERPDLNPTEVSATFRDYWHSQAGQKGVKADWEATWRNWVRNQRMAAKSPQRAAIGYRSQNELVAAELIAELKNG